MRIFADSIRIFEGIKNVKDLLLQLSFYQEKTQYTDKWVSI